jgi:transposase
MMQRALRPSALVPRGFEVESAIRDGATTVITLRPTSDTSLCPGCGASSGRIHSRYQRRLTDLPLGGRPVRLMVMVRRFRCDAVLCGRRIFTERFDDGKKAHADLDSWLERACASLVASFANGVTKDKAAISAAITTSWSNGQTEGHISKLKLVKRQMYGRAKLALLQARLIGAK